MVYHTRVQCQDSSRALDVVPTVCSVLFVLVHATGGPIEEENGWSRPAAARRRSVKGN